MSERIQLQGTSVYEGIVIAPIIRREHRRFQIEKNTIEVQHLEQEYEKFKKAVELSKIEYQSLLSADLEHADFEANSTDEIINIYIMLLEDEIFHARVWDMMKDSNSNVDWVVNKVIQEYSSSLGMSKNDYMVDRIHDINEIGMRIINNIRKGNNKEKVEVKIDKDCIFVTKNLYTSQLLKLPLEFIKGIVLEEGGKASHTAIIAKSYGIPMMVQARGVMERSNTGVMGILDSHERVLILHPHEKEITHFHVLRNTQQEKQQELVNSLSNINRTTKDDIPLSFNINIDVTEELDNPITHYADGIGLFRSEFLLESMDNYHQSEEQQLEYYKVLLEIMGDKPVIIRTFDVGGDKISVSSEQMESKNPLLGYRAIRYCIHNKDFFLHQLCAILRASMFGNLSILIPMITSVGEMIIVHDYIEEAKNILDKRGIAYKSDIPIGIMIEVPSSIYILEDLSQYCDFFSIGSNDLLQYFLAVDRDNAHVQYLYNFTQPSFLRMMRDIFYAAHNAKKPITLCGELASVSYAQPVLLGAGLRNFSVSPSNLAETIIKCCSYHITDTRTLFEQLLSCHTADQVDDIIKDFYRVHNSNNR